MNLVMLYNLYEYQPIILIGIRNYKSILYFLNTKKKKKNSEEE